MGLFTETETYRYQVYHPVVGDSYNTTVPYGHHKEKVPLDVVTTREMLTLHGRGMNNSNNMKTQLKHLREIHNLPMLRKTSEFQSQKIDVKVIDFSKLEAMYGSRVQDISTDVTSALACEYIYKSTNGKYRSVYDIENVVKDEILPKINKEENLGAIVDRSSEKVVELLILFITYIGNNTYNVAAYVRVKRKRFSKGDGYITEFDKVWRNFNVNLPIEFAFLWGMINDSNIYVIKFANGNMAHLDSTFIDNFYKQGDTKLDFSIPVGLKNVFYSPNDLKKMQLARWKLGYEEYKNKKRNRQELLYESILKNKDIEFPCKVNMYLDLYPFKDPRYRMDKNWRLFLKGVMRYFARITGISQTNTGHGITSVLVPPILLNNDEFFIYMNVEIIKEKVSGPDMSKSTPFCFFEKDEPEVTGKDDFALGQGWMDWDTHMIKSLNTIWLCLIVDIGNNEFVKYKLNYSRLYDGLMGFSNSDRIEKSAEIISNINKKLAEEEKEDDKTTTTEDKTSTTEAEENSKFDKLITSISRSARLKNAFWHDDKDISITKWDENSYKIKDIIPTGAPDEDLSHFDVPRLPMPLLMWNMIPYSGKKVAYTSTLLVSFILEVEVEEETGFGAVLSFVVAGIITIVTLGAGAGASSALIGIANSTVSKAIVIAGAWAGAIGGITGNKFLSYFGMAVSAWSGISGLANVLNGGLSSLTTLETLTLGARGASFIVDTVSKIRSLNMEKELQNMADEIKNGQRQFEYERDNRKDMWGGVARTNCAADEEIDQMLELVLQEGLFEVLTSYTDIEKNSTVFNDRKYDNTR